MKKWLLVGGGIGIGFVFAILLVLMINRYTGMFQTHVPYFSQPEGHVRVDFVNETSEDIQTISFDNRPIHFNNLEAGERKTVLFPHLGEGVVSYKIIFDEVDTLEISGHYIESGFFITEHIYKDRVETDF